MLRRSLFLLLSGVLACCGDDRVESADSEQPVISIQFRERNLTAAASPAALPTTLLFALVGPGGTRTETVDYAAHQVSLPHLRRGNWSIRGDGLDVEGKLGWSAKPVVFTVAAGEQVPITLEFVPIE